MRKLITNDIFKFAKIVKAADLKSQLKKIIENGKGIDPTNKEALESVGIEVILTIIESCGNEGVSDAAYDFLSGPLEMTPAEIAALPIPDMIGHVKALSAENDFLSLFKTASKLM